MENKEVMVEEEKNVLEDEQGYAMTYNVTIVSACATVAMFVLGTILYLTIVG